MKLTIERMRLDRLEELLEYFDNLLIQDFREKLGLNDNIYYKIKRKAKLSGKMAIKADKALSKLEKKALSKLEKKAGIK